MSRKHYQRLAEGLASTMPETWTNHWTQWCADVRAVADALEESFENFDRTRFLQACSLEIPIDKV